MKNYKSSHMKSLIEEASKLAAQEIKRLPSREYYLLPISKETLDLFCDGDFIEIESPRGQVTITKEGNNESKIAYFIPTKKYELEERSGDTVHQRTSPTRRPVFGEERFSKRTYRHSLGGAIEE